MAEEPKDKKEEAPAEEPAKDKKEEAPEIKLTEKEILLQKQTALIQEAQDEMNEDNYMRWPFGGFFVASCLTGIIFIMASGIYALAKLNTAQKILCGLMVIVGSTSALLALIILFVFVFYMLTTRVCHGTCVCEECLDRFLMGRKASKRKRIRMRKLKADSQDLELIKTV